MSRQIVISKEEMAKAGFTVVEEKEYCYSLYSRNGVSFSSRHSWEFIADCKEGGVNEAIFIKEGLFNLPHRIQ